MALYEPAHEPLARFCHARLADKRHSAGSLRKFRPVAASGNNFVLPFQHCSPVIEAKIQARQILGLISEKQAFQLPDRNQNPETDAEVRLLYEAMQKIPEVQREPLILFEISGFS